MERLTLPFDRGRFAREALDSTVAYVGVQHAPPGAARTCRDPRTDAVVLRTTLRGRVLEVGPEGLVLACDAGRLAAEEPSTLPSTPPGAEGLATARIRHLLPPSVDLRPLVGHTIALELTERLEGGRCTVDARIRDAHGALVLWARDGRLPEDRSSHGLALRMRMAESGRGLVLSHRAGLAVVRGPGLALVEGDTGAMLVLALRTGDDEAAFVALAR